ncbi:MAG: 7TM diverse intracellular signaling domain-containing protein [Cyclobacteriaceae bacterium]
MHIRLLLFSTIFLICGSGVIYGNTISYLHKDIAFTEISSPQHEWSPFSKRIYEGFDNGVYWFKIECLASEEDQVLTIPESHITKAKLYHDNIEINKQDLSRYITFKIPSSTKKETYYLWVDCPLEARIPINLLGEDEHYHNHEQFDIIVIGIYIGIVLCILIINLFSFFSFGNIIYLQYIFMVIGMSVNAFYKDGLPVLFIGFNDHLELLLNSIIAISAVFFTNSYLRLDGEQAFLRRASIGAVAMAVVLNITYQITESFLIFTIVEVLHLVTLDLNWAIGILRWKKSWEAKLFTLAYGFPLILAHDYYISPHFGLVVFNLPLYFYKIGSVFEMILFSWAIMHQAKMIAKENTSIKQKLMDYASQLKELNKNGDSKELGIQELVNTYNFTLKEIAILKDVGLGKSNKNIASDHFISENTVKYHIKNILNKFEVKNKKEAMDKFLGKQEASLSAAES